MARIPFEVYHRQNPQVWEMFKKVALQTKEKGFSKYSAKGIFEIVRWHTGVRATGDQFKINNNYTPDYARLMIEQHPEFKTFFLLRVRR
jgi:hypothetical protein